MNLFDKRAWLYRKMMDANGGGAAGNGGGNAPEAGEEGARFTQADIDRIVRNTIARERKRAETEISKAKTEAERLAKLSGEEREREEFESRTRALEEREKEITRRELKSQAVNELQKRNIPLELVDLLNMEDAEKCNDSITVISNAFDRALKRAVNDRLKGAPPKTSGTPNMDASEYEKMRRYAGLPPKN